MTKNYKNRKQMLREEYATSFDATKMTLEELKKHFDKDYKGKYHFEVIATSCGMYGVNGAIIEAVLNFKYGSEPIEDFTILERNVLLLSLV